MTSQQAVEAYQKAFASFHNTQEPEVRISDAGGFYVRSPVFRHYTGEDLAKVTRFFQRGIQ